MTEADHPEFSDALEWGLRLHKAGVLEEAAEAYADILARDPAQPEAAFLLGSIELQQGQARAACGHLAVAIVGLEAPEEAQAAFCQALESMPSADRQPIFAEIAAVEPVFTAADRACAYIRTLRILRENDAALVLTDRVLQSTPSAAEVRRLRALLLVDLGNLRDAIVAFEAALAIAPDNCETLTAYSATLARMGYPEEAVAPARHAAELCLENANSDIRRAALLQFVSCQMEVSRIDEAVIVLKELNARAMHLPETWTALARGLHQAGRQAAAEAAAGEGLARFPDHLELEWLHCVYALAPLYRSTADILESRARYELRLKALSLRLQRADDYTRDRARRLSSELTPYLLPYQYGEDDKALQEIYGAMLNRLSDRQALVGGRKRREDGRIVVAFVSGFVWRHTNWRMKRGWLKYLDRERFYVACLHLGEHQDEMTAEIRGYVDEFHHVPSDYEGAVAVLDAMSPDVVFYPEVGMSGVAQRLASGRFAPVQCCAIGHPVTTGLSTMDYFVSGELLEPEGSATHYSERLIKLPGISFPYLPSLLPDAGLGRDHFGLPEERTLYLCLQTPQKYLPADDGLYTRIAKEVPNALFLFLQGGSRIFDMEIVRERLIGSFRRAGLDPEQHLRFLPHLSPQEYQALNAIGDIYLDTPGWSGGNTTLEALYQDLPVVTTRGREMRACVSAGMLSLIGVEETIAEDDDQFVALAARLATDRQWRDEIIGRIRAGRSILETDIRSIDALEAFLENAVGQALAF
jgi:protein O-GlcNAc transferase